MKTSKQRREQRKRARNRLMHSTQTANENMDKIITGFFGKPTTAINTYYLNPFGDMIPMEEQFNIPLPTITSKQKKETDMSTAISQLSVSNERSQEAKAFDRIIGRIQNVYHDKVNDLMKKFGLIDDDRPATPKELVDRIKSGKYVIPEKYSDYRSYSALDFIEWRDPKITKDKEGYDEAKKEVDKIFNETLDVIYISNGEEGLKAFQKFEKSKH